MPRLFGGCLLLIVLSTQTGCASLISGRYQSVHIASMPEHATVSIDGTPSGYTPTNAKLKRRSLHYIVLSKAGYLDENIRTKQGYNWWNAGNVILGGLVGIVVDLATGAVYTVEPKTISAVLTLARPPDASVAKPSAPPMDAPAAAPPRRQSYTDPQTGVTYTPAE